MNISISITSGSSNSIVGISSIASGDASKSMPFAANTSIPFLTISNVSGILSQCCHRGYPGSNPGHSM